MNPKNPIMEIIGNNYPLFYAFITTKYKNYTLKYPQQVFLEQLLSITYQYDIELSTVELTKGFTVDKMGKKRVSVSNGKQNKTGNNVESYTGYDVSGDYQNMKINDDTTTENETTDIENNYYDFLIATNNQKFKANWNAIQNEIEQLFILYFY